MDFKVGTKIKLSDTAGMDKGKTGVIVSPREIKTDGRGVPKIQGHYKPVDWKKEYAIKLDNGEYTTMYKNMTNKISESKKITKRVIKEAPVDLTSGDKKSLAKYIQDNADELNKLEHSKDKDKLIAFVQRSKTTGHHVSDQKLKQIVDVIKAKPFQFAYKYIYDILLKGSNNGVIENVEAIKNVIRKIIKEIRDESK